MQQIKKIKRSSNYLVWSWIIIICGLIIGLAGTFALDAPINNINISVFALIGWIILSVGALMELVTSFYLLINKTDSSEIQSHLIKSAAQWGITLLPIAFIKALKLYSSSKLALKELQELNEVKKTKWESILSYLGFEELSTRAQILDLTLAGMLLAFCILAKYIASFTPMIGVEHLELHYLVFILSLLLIRSMRYKLMFFVITPFILTMFGQIAQNPIDYFLEYILVMWVFFPLMWFDKIVDQIAKQLHIIDKKNKYWTIRFTWFTFSFIILMVIRLMIHVWAGMMYWAPDQSTQYDKFIYSIGLNAMGIGYTTAIILPVGLALFYPMLKMRDASWEQFYYE